MALKPPEHVSMIEAVKVLLNMATAYSSEESIKQSKDVHFASILTKSVEESSR